MSGPGARFIADYARQRAAEGRDYRGPALKALPYLREGPHRRQWAVRARSYEALVRHLLASEKGKLDILDLGAGNGWLSHRLARMGHRAIALDMRSDPVDGLGAACDFLDWTPGLFQRVAAYFEALPFPAQRFDIVLFNAALHYASDLAAVLAEAVRVTRKGGTIAVLDSPFYARMEDGEAMVAEKRAGNFFGPRAGVLLGEAFIEYLTADRLAAALPSLSWRRHPVRYPLWYELRPLVARLKGVRAPSRFDLWTARVP